MLDTVRKLNNHPSIDEVYAEIPKEHTAIGKTIVYHNLCQLADNGIISRYCYRMVWSGMMGLQISIIIVNVKIAVVFSMRRLRILLI